MARTTIPAELVAINAIQGTLIADNAITAVHIATNAVSGTLVADNAITSTHIAQNNVTATQIAMNTITVTQLADSAVETAKLNNDAVTQAKIADDAVGADQLAANSVVSASIVNGSIVEADMADNAVTLAKMASLARGSIIVGDSAGDPSALSIGSNTYVLTSDGTDISWAAPSGGVAGISSSANATAITIDSSGRVLIGADSGDAFNDDSMLRIQRTGDRVFQQFKCDADQNVQILFGDVDDDVECSIQYHPSDKDLRFTTGNNNEAMRIDSSGNVGIGTTGPDDLLDIMGGGYDQIRIGSNKTDNTNKTAGIVSTMYTNNSVSVFQGFFQNGSNAIYYGSADSAHRGINQHYFYTNSNYNATTGHKLRYLINGTGKHTWYGKHQGDSVGHFLFTNNSSEDASNTNCSLVVENGATFLQIMAWTTLGARIGTRTGGWNSTGSQVTYLVSGDTSFAYGNTSGNFFLGSGTAITSDERLKKNIVSTPDGQLAKINALRPVSFDWKDTRKDSGEGFIAQEVEAIIPEAVAESEYAPDPDDDTRDFEGDVKSIRDGVLLSRLVKAVQELSTELDAAKARITTLEG